jgi:diguanylate cyclase (GGDEF)-like protein
MSARLMPMRPVVWPCVAAGEERLDGEVPGRSRAAHGLALTEELRSHQQTMPFSVLALDFDGIREANAAFESYEQGGDVLIRAVGKALPRIVHTGEFPARLYTAGDEFAVVLPGAEQNVAQRRAAEIEAALDLLDVPTSHRRVYHGASVGFATRQPGETTDQVLDRSIRAMRRRKIERERHSGTSRETRA